MKKNVQLISNFSARTKIIFATIMGVIIITICYFSFLKAKPEYDIKLGKLYEITGNTAKLIGDYSEELEIALLNGDEIIIKKINWGGQKTLYIINGEEYQMGPNGKMFVEDNLIVLTDNSHKKKKIDRYGKRVK